MIATICAACVALATPPSFAREVVDAADVGLEWAPATGEVGAYVVFVSRDGGPYRSEQYTTAPRARVGGRLGETVQVLVRAYALSEGRALASASSEPSEPIRFVSGVDGAAPVSAAPPSAAPPPPLALQPSPAPHLVPPFAIQASGDFDGDGDLDLFATLGSWAHPLALLSEDGALEQLTCLAPLATATAAFAADFDGDGRDELAVRDAAGVSLLRLDWPGAAMPVRREDLPRGATALAADLDGDGSASLVTYDPATGRLTDRIAPGQSRDLAARRPLQSLRAGDFDGDGRDDLWVQAGPGEAELWLMREGGRFEVAPMRFDSDLEAPATLDWNGDGRDDLAGWDPARAELRAWLLDGARVIDRRTLGRGAVDSVRALDLDGNGRDDLLVSGPAGTSSAVLSSP